jgi:N-glycosylase/DNA lyase
MADLNFLKKEYAARKGIIQSRLGEFKRFYSEPVCWNLSDGKMVLVPSDRNNDERIFEEMSFCLMTANTSAAVSMKAVDGIREVLFAGNTEDIQKALVKAGYRYPNVRAQYIFEVREKFKANHDLKLRKLIETFDDPKDAREYFVKEVKGFGYKEASHFLRNIGVFGLAILDKHIIRTLHEYGMIEDTPKSLNRKKYLEIEKKLIEFSDILGIDMDELDLLLWSIKNGDVMK